MNGATRKLKMKCAGHMGGSLSLSIEQWCLDLNYSGPTSLYLRTSSGVEADESDWEFTFSPPPCWPLIPNFRSRCINTPAPSPHRRAIPNVYVLYHFQYFTYSCSAVTPLYCSSLLFPHEPYPLRLLVSGTETTKVARKTGCRFRHGIWDVNGLCRCRWEGTSVCSLIHPWILLMNMEKDRHCESRNVPACWKSMRWEIFPRQRRRVGDRVRNTSGSPNMNGLSYLGSCGPQRGSHQRC